MDNSIGERLRRAIKQRGIEQNDLARQLKISPISLSRYVNDRRMPRADLLQRMAKVLDDPSLLAFKDEVGGVVAEAKASYRPMPRPEFIYLPCFDVAASAGHGAEVPTELVVGVLGFRREWVRAELGVDSAQLAVISVRGDSMEPTLRAGDLVVIDRRESTPAHEGLYVVRIGNGLLVKRVQLLPDRTLVLRSEHPAYQPLTLRLDEVGEQIAVIGRVVWIGRKL